MLVNCINVGGSVTGLSTSSSNALTQRPTPASESDLHDTSVDEVYRQATEFISLTEQLKQGLSDEQSQQTRLRDACVQVTECIETMRQTVRDLQARAKVTDNLS